jgi:hypothetical protein
MSSRRGRARTVLVGLAGTLGLVVPVAVAGASSIPTAGSPSPGGHEAVHSVPAFAGPALAGVSGVAGPAAVPYRPGLGVARRAAAPVGVQPEPGPWAGPGGTGHCESRTQWVRAPIQLRRQDPCSRRRPRVAATGRPTSLSLCRRRGFAHLRAPYRPHTVVLGLEHIRAARGRHHRR